MMLLPETRWNYGLVLGASFGKTGFLWLATTEKGYAVDFRYLFTRLGRYLVTYRRPRRVPGQLGPYTTAVMAYDEAHVAAERWDFEHRLAIARDYQDYQRRIDERLRA